MNKRRSSSFGDAFWNGTELDASAWRRVLQKISPMSALGQKRTCAVQEPMSALPPKATLNAFIACPLWAKSGHRHRLFRSADGLDWHALARLQQRLKIAKHPRPTAATLRGIAATRHHASDHRCTSDVVGNGDGTYTALALVDLVREACGRLCREICVEEWVPSLRKFFWA